MKNCIYVTLLFCFIAASLTSYSQIYLYIDGVKIENSPKGHTNEIQIDSFSWGVSNTFATSGGRTSAKANASAVNLVKTRDQISGQLQQAAFSGKAFSKAEIRFYKNDGSGKEAYVYLTIYIEQVNVESYKLSGSGAEKTSESIALNFSKILFEDVVMEGGRLVKKTRDGWDFAKNAAIK